MFKSPSKNNDSAKDKSGQKPFFGKAIAPANAVQPFFQPKLTINQAGDKYEQEADAMAEKVVNSEAANRLHGRSEKLGNSLPTSQPSPISSISRKCADCAKEDELQREELKEEKESLQLKPLMRAAAGDGGQSASPKLVSQLNSKKGRGQSLPKNTLSSMNQVFGTDFSNVRVHTGNQAQEMSKSIQAKAFTHGSDIYFNKRQYNPGSTEGKRLLGHELTHVVQQSSPRSKIQRQPDGENLGGTKGLHDELTRQFAKEVGIPFKPGLQYTEQYRLWLRAGSIGPESVAQSQISDNDVDLIITQIHKAAKGWGTDEEAIYRALQRLNKQEVEIERVKRAFEKKYGKTLEYVLRDELSGKELSFALELIGIHPIDKETIGTLPVTEEDYDKAAARLNKAMKGWGTDEEAIYAVLLPFRGNNEAMEKLKDHYQKKFHENLDEALSSELSGSEKDYAYSLMDKHRYTSEEAKFILSYIKTEAAKSAENPPAIDPSSTFYKRLKDHYLKDYFANPVKAEGQKALEGIGRQLEGRRSSSGIEVKPKGGMWRPAEGRWEGGAILFWNKTKVPQLPPELRDLSIFKNIKTLPSELTAATDILIKENVDVLPFIDVPFLLGKPNPGTHEFDIDIVGGGRNVSQLMHWATGVKYAGQTPQAMRELFLAYEIWHLEGWDVFGQDALNDLIAEEQGRMLGAELLKGEDGKLKSEADLLPFLNETFLKSRAWVGALLRIRREELEKWILSKKQPKAIEHWDEDRKFYAWNRKEAGVWKPAETIYEMLARGVSVEDVKKSQMVKSQIEIYSLLYEADKWEQTKGTIELTDLEKRLASGKLNNILSLFALMEEKKGYKASQDLGRLKRASSERKELK